MKINNSYPGLYVVFEGIVGTGKSTQMDFLEERLRQEFPQIELLRSREPGGTPRAEELRNILKHQKLEPVQEMSMYAEARESLQDESLIPFLKSGGLAILDRSFYSSLSYQGGGRWLGLRRVYLKNENLIKRLHPDVVMYFDVNVEEALWRSSKDKPDKFDEEDLNFWRRARNAYVEAFRVIGMRYPEAKFISIEDLKGTLSKQETHELVWANLYPIIKSWAEIREGAIVRELQGIGKERLR